MCTCSPESQSDPGLHEKMRSQQGKVGYSAPLLHSCEISLGILPPALGSSVKGRHGPVKTRPEEGHENALRSVTPLL